jgi:hypothetical protein
VTDTPIVKARNRRGGRFAPGNRAGGTTSAAARRRSNIERAFRKAITVDDFEGIAREIKIAAMMPASSPEEWRVKLDAAKYITDRLLGKPKQQVDVEVTQTAADPKSVSIAIYNAFGITPEFLASQASKQVQSITVEAIDAPIAVKSLAGPVVAADGLPEAEPGRPDAAEGDREGAAVGLHLDGGPLVGPPPARQED